MIDEIILSKELIRCKSVTPNDGGAIELLASNLEPLGFKSEIVSFNDHVDNVKNIYLRYGDSRPNLCFAGHTDVVPVGDEAAWQHDPFGAIIEDGKLYGRGAVDMKPAIAAFAAACNRVIANHKIPGSLSFLITGDEEARSVNGTRKLLSHITNMGEKLDACIVGEPTNPSKLGEMIKIGRRGTITFHLVVHGKQGHVAYPQNADNPVTRIIQILHELKNLKLDSGNEHFQPSNLEVTSIDVGNKASNVIANNAKATFNIRFNNEHTWAELEKLVREICQKHSSQFDLEHEPPSDSFLTKEGLLAQYLSQACKEICNSTAELSTSGGTSDARFIKDYCQVVEFGLINQMAHKIDEFTEIEDVRKLSQIYEFVILKYFNLL